MEKFKVGIIVYYDSYTKFGIIKGTENDSSKGYPYPIIVEFQFKLIGEELSEFKIGDIVGFFVEDGLKNGMRIKHIINYWDFVNSTQYLNLDFDEWLLILKGCNKPFLPSKLRTCNINNSIIIDDDLEREIELLSKIDTHVENCNFDELLRAYSIKIINTHRNKIGDDDSVWLYNVSYWRLSNKNFIVDNLWSKCYFDLIYEDDYYIKSLFPIIKEEIMHKSDYCSYIYILEEILNDKIKMKSLCLNALKLRKEIRENAKCTYNKDTHKFILKTKLKESIQKRINVIDAKVNDFIERKWGLNTILNNEKGWLDIVEKFDLCD